MFILKNKEKQEKKFNPYNLFVYGFKATGILGMVCMACCCIQAFFPEWLNYSEQIILITVFFIDVFIMMVFIHFMGIYEKKITTYIEKPRKPYKIELQSIDIDKVLEKNIIAKNFEIRHEEQCVAYYKKRSNWKYKAKYILDVIVVCSIQNVDKNIKNHIVKIRQWAGTLKNEKCLRQTIILLKISKMDDEFWKYLMNSPIQYYNNYMLLAVLVEDEKCIYIPYPRMFQLIYHNMKKLLKDVLKEKIIKERKRY